MALNDTTIRALKPRDKAFKVVDEKGPYLLVTPTGGRLWHWKFVRPEEWKRNLPLGPIPI